MLRVFVVTTLLLTCIDHWTTYLCLHAPIEGWSVMEANPVADWLFDRAGLGFGLLIDSIATIAAVLFLSTTHIFSRTVKLALLGVITLSTGYAVVNNLAAMSQMGIDPLGGLV